VRISQVFGITGNWEDTCNTCLVLCAIFVLTSTSYVVFYIDKCIVSDFLSFVNSLVVFFLLAMLQFDRTVVFLISLAVGIPAIGNLFYGIG